MAQLEHITPEQIAQYGVVAAPDRLTGKAQDNKAIFDRLVRELVSAAVNSIIDKTNELLSAEDTREKNEAERVSAEAAREQAENSRVSAEQGRVLEEQDRVIAEQGRASAEAARALAEWERVANENLRKTAETARAQAEAGRASAEAARVSAEEDRAEAETGRDQAEALRESATSGIVAQAAQMALVSRGWAQGGSEGGPVLDFNGQLVEPGMGVSFGGTSAVYDYAPGTSFQVSVTGYDASGTTPGEMKTGLFVSYPTVLGGQEAERVIAFGVTFQFRGKFADAFNENTYPVKVSIAKAAYNFSGTSAKEQAVFAQSWAVGGTGSREGEDTNNARYWAEQAAQGGGSGSDGATFTPSVSPDGVISWTNDKGLPNPDPVDIMGPQGPKGDTGDTGPQGSQGPAGAAGQSAYEAAQAGGYTGTQQEFYSDLAQLEDGPFLPQSGGRVTTLSIQGLNLHNEPVDWDGTGSAIQDTAFLEANGPLIVYGTEKVRIGSMDSQNPAGLSGFEFSPGSVSLTENLNAAGSGITNLKPPSANRDAATKEYVDQAVSGGSEIDDTAVSAEKTWSSKNIVEKLAPAFENSGPVVTCNPVEGYPLHVVSQIVAVQAGEGDPSPANVRPISGWDAANLLVGGTNLVNIADAEYLEPVGDKFNPQPRPEFQAGKVICGYASSNYWTNENADSLVLGDGEFTYNFNTNSYGVAFFFNLTEGKTYTLSCEKLSQIYIGVVQYDASGEVIGARGPNTGASITFTVSENANSVGLLFTLAPGQSTGVVTVSGIQLSAGGSALPYAPYNPASKAINLPFGQTVYGGTLDWTTGVLTVDWVGVGLDGQTDGNFNSNLNLIYVAINTTDTGSSALCSHVTNARLSKTGVGYVYFSATPFSAVGVKDFQSFVDYCVAQASQGTPVQVAYQIIDPITIQLTPTEILALSGTNTIYTDAGDTTVSGRADPNAIIQQLTARIAALESAVVSN